MASRRTDVLIIGGGAGGLSAASGLAQLGLDTTLINIEQNMGGDCLHYGCVPSKTLIRAAKWVHHAKLAESYGVKVDLSALSASAIFESVQKVIKTIQPHDSIERFEKLGVHVFIGTPKFTDPHTVVINDETVHARYIILATGSRPGLPPIPGLDNVKPLTNESVFKLERIPRRLALIGGGAIGCELAQAMTRLGSEVTLLEAAPQILPFLDKDMAELVVKRLQSESIRVLSEVRINSCERSDSGITVTYAHDNTSTTETFDDLLVAAGRIPNTEGLGLETIGLSIDRGGIVIDARCRTRYKHLFAIGDVSNTPAKFTHNAEMQAGIVLQNIAFRLPKQYSSKYIPACVYLDPEVAIIGMNEREARRHYGNAIEVETLSFADLDRARTDAATYGMGKMILYKGKLMGVTIVGPHAGDLITEWGYVLNKKLKLSDLASSVHPYPNYAQWNKRITGKYYGKLLFSPKTRWLVRFLHGKWF